MSRRPRLLLPVAAIVALALVAWLAVARAGPADGKAVLAGMEAILRRQGLATALDSLEMRVAGDSGLAREAHQIAHTLGRQAVALRPGDASILRECSPAFASGCYHGAVEGMLHAGGRIDVPALERLCVGADRSGPPGPGFECIHGLGHGMLGARKYDLEATLQDCDRLSTARRAASCHSGAFMEAVNHALGSPAMATSHTHGDMGHRDSTWPLEIDPADPYTPCGAFEDPYATSCWLFQGFLILRANGFDTERALKVCDKAPQGRVARCYESVGHQITGLFQRGDRWVLDQCARGQPALARHCAAGAVLALNAMDWSGTRSADFCEAAPAEWKDACYRSALGALVDLAPAAERARLCSGVDSAYVAGCRQAGELAEPAGAEPRL